MSFLIIKTKLEIIPLGQQSPLFWWWQNTWVKNNWNEELGKLPLNLCLYIKFNHIWLKDIILISSLYAYKYEIGNI